ncbi:hypothetical protein CAFE_18720 [Caprobacter fermentans]|uniref:Uncharacterized protein n=1 Tax=Caproicibacter fermentans TaxID=2576756 RepID=A0A6N8HZZ8_9FIRM|nr:hypothetical protein [Caproicibacter fermentans]MVB11165.1 hypothetical protein [Caproicibacter fermentans]
MPAEMTPLEAAEIMEESARQAKCMIDAPTTFFSAASQSAGVERVKKCEMAYSLAASYLRAVAAGELRPVIHGRWIYKDCNGVQTENHGLVAYAECSNCGHEICNIDQEAAHCPSCGALMGGKGDST